jgi:hypothetical protein
MTPLIFYGIECTIHLIRWLYIRGKTTTNTTVSSTIRLNYIMPLRMIVATNCGSTGHKCIDLYTSMKVFLWPVVDPQFVAITKPCAHQDSRPQGTTRETLRVNGHFGGMTQTSRRMSGFRVRLRRVYTVILRNVLRLKHILLRTSYDTYQSFPRSSIRTLKGIRIRPSQCYCIWNLAHPARARYVLILMPDI